MQEENDDMFRHNKWTAAVKASLIAWPMKETRLKATTTPRSHAERPQHRNDWNEKKERTKERYFSTGGDDDGDDDGDDGGGDLY